MRDICQLGAVALVHWQEGALDGDQHFEHRFRPLSAGVPLGGRDGLARALTDPVALAITAGLVLGKPAGVMAATGLMARFTRADLDENLAWVDVIGLPVLVGIGFGVGQRTQGPDQDRGVDPSHRRFKGDDRPRS